MVGLIVPDMDTDQVQLEIETLTFCRVMKA